MTKDTKGTKKNIVFLVSAIITIVIALWGIFANGSFAFVADIMMQGLKDNFSWLYLIVMLFFVLFCIVLTVSPFGKVRLGADDEKPEYGNLSWFAMLFVAGMGVGLVFWGVAEPLSHYVAPMKGIEAQTQETANFAVRSSFMHWGLHPWACYTVLGLALAYFLFRKKQPVLVSSLLKPILGEKRIGHTVGTVVDIFTTVLTVIGVAGSFGMACLQISSGLEYLFNIPSNAVVWAIIIVLVFIVFLRSSLSGVGKGIKYLSNFNLVTFILVIVIAILIGSNTGIFNIFFNGLKDYMVNFFPDSVRTSSQGDTSWIRDWRVFYWAWWLSWAPFVGVFIARISKGRTIRQFVLGVMIIPTLVSCVWFSVFSGLTFNVVDAFSTAQLTEILAKPETALFYIFGQYDFGFILSLIAMILLVTFFITSADSATFVLAMLTSDGNLNPKANRKVFWGILIAVVAFALILSGGISVIQTISIDIAFPYLIVLLLICACLMKALITEIKK